MIKRKSSKYLNENMVRYLVYKFNELVYNQLSMYDKVINYTLYCNKPDIIYNEIDDTIECYVSSDSWYILFETNEQYNVCELLNKARELGILNEMECRTC